MKWVGHTLRFGCELALLTAFVWWGFTGGAAQAVLGVAAAVAAVAVWARFVAPRSQHRLADPARFVVEVILFAAGTAAFAGAGQPAVAAVFGVAALATAAFVRVVPEPLPPGRT